MGEQRNSWRFWTGAIGGVLVSLAAVGFILRVWQKIASGHGLDQYFTGFGVQFNYFGAAVVFGLIPIVLVVGLALRYWHGRHERDFKRRYGITDD